MPKLMKQTARKGALVIGANYRALGVVRSLGRRGIVVWVLKERMEILASVSRYTQRSFNWPDGDDQEKIRYLIELSACNEIAREWVLIPTDDDGARIIAQNHEILSKYFTLTTPPWDVLQWAYDKRLTYSLCVDLNVDFPQTFCPSSRDEVVALDCAFPVILKPAYKSELNALTSAKAWCVSDRTALLAAYDKACRLVDPKIVMIQELVVGAGESQFSYAILAKDGIPLASVTARRLRQIPMDFGRFSTYVETVDEYAIVAPSLLILKALRFTGLAEIEFKRDERDGRLKLLDINPRIWGWHTLCESAGVDFPYLLWQMVCGYEFPPANGAPGLGWMRLAADLPIAVELMMRRRLKLRAYFKSLHCTVEEAIFAIDDLVPALVDLPYMLLKLGKRLLFRRGG